MVFISREWSSVSNECCSNEASSDFKLSCEFGSFSKLKASIKVLDRDCDSIKLPEDFGIHGEGLTFDMSGGWKRAKPAGNRPLDGGVRPRVAAGALAHGHEKPSYSDEEIESHSARLASVD